MTSHEMRNPLSAVLQCADSSVESVKQISQIATPVLRQTSEQSHQGVQEEVRSCLDALHTIISCSLHQKRVIDDILTLSKLDSNLILITPIRVRPTVVVEDAVKMFEIECAKEGISLTFAEDDSLYSVGAIWVMMDPSRVLQVCFTTSLCGIKLTDPRFSSIS